MPALSRGCLVAAVFSKNWDSPHNLKNWRSGIKWISNEKRWREESMKTWRFHMNLVFLPGKAEKNNNPNRPLGRVDWYRQSYAHTSHPTWKEFRRRKKENRGTRGQKWTARSFVKAHQPTSNALVSF
jgi:hypothetical protein